MAGLFFFILAAQLMVVLMLAGSIALGYDFNQGAISDLGVIDETFWLFNSSLVLTGVLNLAAALLLVRSRRSLPVLFVYGLASVGAIGAGLIHLGNPWHGIFALLAFLFFNIETLVGAIRLKGAIRWIGIGLGTLGLIYVVVMFIGDSGQPAIFGAIGHGGSERMIVYPPMLWLMVFGGYLMARREALPALGLAIDRA